jgi:hypothetical protein
MESGANLSWLLSTNRSLIHPHFHMVREVEVFLRKWVVIFPSWTFKGVLLERSNNKSQQICQKRKIFVAMNCCGLLVDCTIYIDIWKHTVAMNKLLLGSICGCRRMLCLQGREGMIVLWTSLWLGGEVTLLNCPTTHVNKIYLCKSPHLRQDFISIFI